MTRTLATRPARRSEDSAPEAYAKQVARIRAAVELLGRNLARHAERGSESANWGFAGDLVEVAELVERAACHLSQS